MRPDDIVQPTELCLQIIHKFKPHHRGTVLARPDRYHCVSVLWKHKTKPMLMARRYVEIAAAALAE